MRRGDETEHRAEHIQILHMKTTVHNLTHIAED